MLEITPGDKLQLSVGVIPEVVMDQRMGPEVLIGQATVPGGEIRPGEIMSVRLPTAIAEQLGEVEEDAGAVLERQVQKPGETIEQFGKSINELARIAHPVDKIERRKALHRRLKFGLSERL